MIAKDEYLRKICSNYEQVENYKKAVADKENKWHMHHRRETDEMKSMQQLIDEGKYFDVEPEELIFLIMVEHMKLHNTGKIVSEEARKKMSEAANRRPPISEETRKKFIEIRSGENNGMFGKKHSEEARNKMSERAKQRIGENHNRYGKGGWHWWNNCKVEIQSKEQPGPDFVRGRLKHNK